MKSPEVPMNQKHTPRQFEEQQTSLDHGQPPTPVASLSAAVALSGSKTSDISSNTGGVQQFVEQNTAQANKGSFDKECWSRALSSLPRDDALPLQDKKYQGSPMIEQILSCPMAIRLFWAATLVPPITKLSLSELDISSIINNPKLRHDVNFDRDLHFRPNLDGQKGQLKRETQRGYWQAITAELQLYEHMGGPFDSVAAETHFKTDCYRRIPPMFETVKEILKNLVPDRDQAAVDEHLDVPMIMQEIGKGVCDFLKLAAWLAQLLKRHCAPMRDEMVDRMVQWIQKGDAASIATGICELFGVLEAMKLDVANHQIRHLRALLIGDTISFEQKYHASRMRRERYNVQYARSWYLKGRKRLHHVPLLPNNSWVNRDVEVFLTSFLMSLIPTMSTDAWPDTFTLDAERLRVLKAELQDLLHEQIYCHVLARLVESRRKPGTSTTAQRTNIQPEIQNIVSDGRLTGLPTSNVIAELVRQALRMTGSNELHNAQLEDLADMWLEEALCSPDLLHKYAENLMMDLSGELLRNVEKHLTRSPWDIFNILIAPTQATQPPILPSLLPIVCAVSPRTRRTDIINRITHIAVLHWRIWENLIYNNEELGQTPELPEQMARGSATIVPLSRSIHPQSGTGRKRSQTTASDIDQTAVDPFTQTATPTRP